MTARLGRLNNLVLYTCAISKCYPNDLSASVVLMSRLRVLHWCALCECAQGPVHRCACLGRLDYLVLHWFASLVCKSVALVFCLRVLR